jgi:hypothetical protein
MTPPPVELGAAIDWLLAESAKIEYGEVALVVITHAGRISRIERTVTTKSQAYSGRPT